MFNWRVTCSQLGYPDSSSDVWDISGWFKSNDGGPYLQTFQRAFAEFCKTNYAFGVSSGSAAIYVALKACGVGPGDLVAVPTYTHIGSVAPIILAGGTPRFVDVDKYGNFDPDALNHIPLPKAIIVVHQLGVPCQMDAILDHCQSSVALVPYVIEDASHALGSEYYFEEHNGAKAGSLGDIGCFSIGGGRTKTIGTGEGGMIVTNNDELAKRCKNIRNHGDRNFDVDYFCFNFRMSDLNAAIGLMQMDFLNHFINWQVNAAEYIISNLPEYLEYTPLPPNVKTVHYLIGCRFNPEKVESTREQFLQTMKEKGFQIGPRQFVGGGYSKLISDVKYYQRFPMASNFPMARKLLAESIWIDWHRFPRTKTEADNLLEVLRVIK